MRVIPPDGDVRPDISPATRKVLLDLAEFDRLTALRGWTTDAARVRALRISDATMSRIRTGKNNCGSVFVHLCLTTLDVPYNVLFYMEDDESLGAAS